MTDVVGPMAEAADYERLQMERRRGVVCLLLGLFTVAAMMWALDSGRTSSDIWLPLSLGLFLGVAIARRILKRRLEWKALFGQYSAGEPRFWHWLVVVLVAPLVAFVLVVNFSLSWRLLDVAFGPAAALIAFGSGWKSKDWQLFHIGWFPLVAGTILVTPVVPAPLSLMAAPLILAVLAIPLLGLAGWRMLAPREWLVR